MMRRVMRSRGVGVVNRRMQGVVRSFSTEAPKDEPKAVADEENKEKTAQGGGFFQSLFGLENDNLVAWEAVASTGIIKKELDYNENEGSEMYQYDPIIPEDDEGTLDKPIKVPSVYDRRVVGFEDPFTQQLQWFMLEENKIHYIKIIDKYFKLERVEEM